jgi:hypothetical protein
MVVGFVLAVALIASLACGALPGQHTSAAAPAAYQLSGHLDLTFGDWSWDTIGGPCHGTGGYSDVVGGAQISVLNASGTIIGLGKLADGIGESTGFSPCILDFTVSGLPHTSIYQLRVNQRGAPSYSFADLQRARWTIAMTLGR